MDRTLLYNQINHRIDLMMKDGLLNEVKNLYEQGYEDCQSMRAIGYKEFLPYFKGEQSLERSIEILKRNSRRYAKRQYTWFKNKMNIHWYTITPSTIDECFETILRNLADRKSTRLNCSHVAISYADFCLKKKTTMISFDNGSAWSNIAPCYRRCGDALCGSVTASTTLDGERD